MPPAGSVESRQHNGFLEEPAYPSRTIAYQAAGMITSIVEALQKHVLHLKEELQQHNELRTPMAQLVCVRCDLMRVPRII